MMKRIVTMIMTCASAACLAGCRSSVIDEIPSVGAMSAQVSVDDLPSRATPQSVGREATVSDVQYLVFGPDGRIADYSRLDGSSAIQRWTSRDLPSEEGYSLRAVVNGPDLSGVPTLSQLEAVTATLGDFNGTSEDFLMGGKRDGIEVSAGDVTSLGNIPVSRYVSRVTLVSVTNNLPLSISAMTLVCAFLSNVPSTVSLFGTLPQNMSEGVWINKEGRSDAIPRRQDLMIDEYGSNVSLPDLTYRRLSVTIPNECSSTEPIHLYSYPNPYVGARVDGFNSPFRSQHTRLVLRALYLADGDIRYTYYPVVLDRGLEANCDCRISLTVNGPGTDDPNGVIEKGNLVVDVTAIPWDAGGNYVETL